MRGWAGDCFDRNVACAMATFTRLRQNDALPTPPARMLEIGCGNGVSSALMAARGYEVHGVDISREAIHWARDRFVESGLVGKFYEGNVCNMSFLEDSFFDVVQDGSCLHCLIGIDRPRCLGEVVRVLRPNGVFIVSSMCGLPRSDEAKARFDVERGYLLEGSLPYRTLKSLDQLCEELTAAGFEPQDTSLSANPWWDHATIVCRSTAPTRGKNL